MSFKSFIWIYAFVMMPFLLAGQAPGEQGYKDEPVMPEGLKGERISALLQAINNFSPENLGRFLGQHCAENFRALPLEQHLEIFRGMHREFGELTFHSVRKYTPPRLEETVVIVKDANFESWRGLVLMFDPSEEQRIAGIQIAPARTPSDVEEAPISEEEMLEKTTAILEKLNDQDLFSGTVLIARGDRVLLERAYGEATKRFHVPNNIDTKFNLGSMNKMFTATAILQLVESGILDLEDPISKYVDESWLPKSITDKVTIHHLLSHTSGLGSYFNDRYWESSRALFRELNDYKPLVKEETLAFEPGERFQYSNTGMFLLGVIIESASGENYFDFIREHIYRPAGMDNTDCYEMDRPVENLAIGYIPEPNHPLGWKNNLYMHVLKGGPAGGGFSTVRDLNRFARALTSGKLVSKESLNKMWTSHSDAGYGYGFSIEEGSNGTRVGHGGGFPGLNANLDIFLDQGYQVAVLSNYDQAATPVAQKIRELLGRMKQM